MHHRHHHHRRHHHHHHLHRHHHQYHHHSYHFSSHLYTFKASVSLASTIIAVVRGLIYTSRGFSGCKLSCSVYLRSNINQASLPVSIHDCIVKWCPSLLISFIQSGGDSSRQHVHLFVPSTVGCKVQRSLLGLVMECEACLFVQKCIHYLSKQNMESKITCFRKINLSYGIV